MCTIQHAYRVGPEPRVKFLDHGFLLPYHLRTISMAAKPVPKKPTPRNPEVQAPRPKKAAMPRAKMPKKPKAG